MSPLTSLRGCRKTRSPACASPLQNPVPAGFTTLEEWPKISEHTSEGFGRLPISPDANTFWPVLRIKSVTDSKKAAWG